MPELMAAKVPDLEPAQGKTDYFHDFDESEETLSLCDLVINSPSSSDYWDDRSSSKEKYRSSSFDDQEQDFFEFFSEDYTASSTNFASDNIIFCGKIIPSKDQLAIPENTLNHKTHQPKQKIPKKFTQIFPWKSNSFHRSKIKTLPGLRQEKDQCRALSFPESKYSDSRFDISVKKVSILATPIKSRWYLFMFGVGKFPMDMELRDMKTRQSRRMATMFQSNGGKPVVKGSSQRRGKALWGLLRFSARRSQQKNTVAKGSRGCIPHV